MSKEQLCFDPSIAVDEQDTVGTYLLNPADDTPIGVTGGGLNVNIVGSSGSIEVTATDLDIRDLTDGAVDPGVDRVKIGDGTDTLEVNADGSINVNSTAQGPIKFINSGAAVVSVEEDVAPLPVKLQSLGGDINVTAGDLNVQLDHTGATFDSVRLGDGTELAAITTNADLQVVDRANTAMKVTTETIGTSYAEVVSTPLSERKRVRIQNRSKRPMTISNDIGASTGEYILPSKAAIDLDLGPNVDIFMKAADAGQEANIIELA